VQWLVDGRLVGETEATRPFQHAYAEPGPHTITVLGNGGNFDQVAIRVLR